jgi:hypothetical protein
MSMAEIRFNPDAVEDDGVDFAPLPQGRYLVEIIESDTRPTKSGSGEYVHLKMRVVEGPYENRLLFDNLNYINQHATTQQIAQKSLRRLCRLCSVEGELENTEQLHFHRFHVSVSVKADAGYGPQNAVRYPDAPDPDQPEMWDGKMGGVPQPPATPAPKPAAAARPVLRPAATGAAKPWQKTAANKAPF